MDIELLEAGKIVNTHGVRGEVKIIPWADSPEFLTRFESIFIDGVPTKVLSARIHKDCVIAVLEGVTDISAAIGLKNKVVCIDKAEAKLEDGRYFVADLIGLQARDFDTGDELGLISDVMSLPSNNVYVIKGSREIMVPAVDEFIKQIDIENGSIIIKLIEGM